MHEVGVTAGREEFNVSAYFRTVGGPTQGGNEVCQVLTLTFASVMLKFSFDCVTFMKHTQEHKSNVNAN